MVFLHGIGGGSATFARQIREFRKHFNVLLIDLPGHGKSQYGLVDMMDTSFVSIAKEVIKVLDKLEIEKAHFLGISLGTIVAHAIKNIASERVDSMILGGAVEKFNMTAKGLMGLAKILKHALPYMWLYRLCAFILMPKKHHKESRIAFIKEAYKLGREEFLKWFMVYREVEGTVKPNQTNQTEIRKLYIMGSEDYMFLPYIEKQVNKTKMDELHIIDRCGHVCNLECPSEFNETSIRFLLNLDKAKIA